MSRWGISIAVALIGWVSDLPGKLVCADELNAAMNSIAIPDIQAHIEVLADDAMEGREAGSRGARAAADYLSREIRRTGVEAEGRSGHVHPGI